MKKYLKIGLAILTAAAMSLGLIGCSKKSDQVVIYSNADEEAVTAIKDALDQNGYKGKYIFQTFGTSELGGKILAEGNNLEADLITMSSYYVDSAQTQNQMFLDLTFPVKTLQASPSYSAPITAQEGAILINTQVMADEGLAMPANIKDLADPMYEGKISVTDIAGSSTAWLMIQAIVESYGMEDGKEVLSGIFKNAGPHIENSGSGPIKKVRAGEVAIGFGLRHQAVADQAKGIPIDYVDPAEGNFSLEESVAVINKDSKTNPLAMDMAKCIIEYGRTALQKTYPLPLYEGESTEASAMSANPKVFSQPLTVDLLQEHTKFSNSCK